MLSDPMLQNAVSRKIEICITEKSIEMDDW